MRNAEITSFPCQHSVSYKLGSSLFYSQSERQKRSGPYFNLQTYLPYVVVKRVNNLNQDFWERKSASNEGVKKCSGTLERILYNGSWKLALRMRELVFHTFEVALLKEKSNIKNRHLPRHVQLLHWSSSYLYRHCNKRLGNRGQKGKQKSLGCDIQQIHQKFTWLFDTGITQLPSV